MARPREFDEVEAMNSAVEVFMSKGYVAASLMDLLKSMKLSKSSLYNSFGTKHELFLSAIDHYTLNAESRLRKNLEGLGTAREKLERILEAVVRCNISDTESRGCLLHNSALEVLPHDSLAAEKIASGIARLKDIYMEIIRDGQQKGEISDRYSVETLGDLFLNAVMGLRSFARVHPDDVKLKQLSKNVLDTIF